MNALLVLFILLCFDGAAALLSDSLMDPCIIAGRSIDRAMLPVAVYEVSGGGVVGMLVVAELVMVSCALHVCTL
jgi:hypothetical protein